MAKLSFTYLPQLDQATRLQKVCRGSAQININRFRKLVLLHKFTHSTRSLRDDKAFDMRITTTKDSNVLYVFHPKPYLFLNLKNEISWNSDLYQSSCSQCDFSSNHLSIYHMFYYTRQVHIILGISSMVLYKASLPSNSPSTLNRAIPWGTFKLCLNKTPHAWKQQLQAKIPLSRMRISPNEIVKGGRL